MDDEVESITVMSDYTHPRQLAAIAAYRERQQPPHLTQAMIDSNSDRSSAAFSRRAIRFHRVTLLGRIWRWMRCRGGLSQPVADAAPVRRTR